MASATRPFRFESCRISERLLAAEGIAGAIAALKSHLHQDLEADAKQSVWQRVAANYFGQILMGHCRGFFGIGHGDKKPHTDGISSDAGLEVYPGAGNAHAAA